MKHHVDTAAFGHRVWPARADALTLIRHEVRRWLGPLEVTPEVEADLVLAVNEAASNVIDHAYRTPGYRAIIELFFWTEPGALLLKVVDHGHWRVPGAHATGRERGIAIMQIPVFTLRGGAAVGVSGRVVFEIDGVNGFSGKSWTTMSSNPASVSVRRAVCSPRSPVPPWARRRRGSAAR